MSVSRADFHAAGLADPRSDHRERQSPGCACYWCRPGACELCGLAHTNPSVTAGCLDHALAGNAESYSVNAEDHRIGKADTP